MGLLSMIKRMFKKNDTNVKEEIPETNKLEISGSSKFPKKVGKASINVESKPKEEEKPKKVNNFVSKNNEFFSEKASKGKRKYSNYNKNSKRKYTKKRDK